MLPTKKGFHYRCAVSVVSTLVVFFLVTNPGANAHRVVEKQPIPTSLWTVTNNADAGPGSLRQVLLNASNGDTVVFSPSVFPPSNPMTITLTSALPTITQDNLTIDASDAGVILDGSIVGGELTPGLNIQASGVTVRGLQIVNFSGCGIEIHGHANVVGGDRLVGTGPLGQGNLLSGSKNHSGIGLFNASAYSNTIQGNLIGVSADGLSAWGNAGDGVHINGSYHNTIVGNIVSGNAGNGIQGCCNADSSYNLIYQNLIGVGNDGTQPIPNGQNGIWFHDGASHNVVGSANIIAHNVGAAVAIQTPASQGNTVTGNSIYENGDGISLYQGGNTDIAPPIVLTFDIAEGVVQGFTCPGCRVEVFSDDSNQGRQFEGSTFADDRGFFALDRATAFIGPYLTATTTDGSGNTSEFSPPTNGAHRAALFQLGNTNPAAWVRTKKSPELADNGFGVIVSGMWNLPSFDAPIDCANELGIKVMRATISEGDATYIYWDIPELPVDPSYDRFFTMTIEAGMTPIYNLIFWDKAWYNGGGSVPIPRFQTQDEIDRYLAYVDAIIDHFGNRIDVYELWNEPTNENTIQTIEIEDYIELATQAIPRIKARDPGAKVVVGSVSGMNAPHLRAFLLTLIENDDVMQMADIVAWHPFFGDSPEIGGLATEYYAGYPALVQSIQQTARAHGFTGTFRADEIVYNSPDECPPGSPSCGPVYFMYSDSRAAKYYARAIMMNAGMDVAPGPLVGCHRQAATPTKVLATLLAGAHAETFPFSLTTAITNVVSYTLELANGDRLVAFWDHSAASDDYIPTEATLRLPGLAGHIAYGVDPVYGIQQPLVVSEEGDHLLIQSLLLKDYPVLVRLSPERRVYLPLISKMK
ncbi:MAG: right-handed parallel beta-helix repeat-containing protein [Chloroflexi bacterium]|nr:right-handed parallel beta-helix repeat-containing protein [Chloroflexota bacterium]